MAKDEEREKEAYEWIEGCIGDIDEHCRKIVENEMTNNKRIIESIKTLDNRIDLLEKVILTSGTPELKKEFLKMIKKEMQGN
jgi:hypothetical protein